MAKIKLSKELYSEKCLRKAMADYSSLAQITIEYDQELWLIQFSNCKYEANRTISEFENYLIELENQ